MMSQPTTSKNPATDAPEKFISKREVATLLNRTVRTVSNWMKRGILPYYKFGHRISFRWSEVLAHLQENFHRSRRRHWGEAQFPIKKDLSVYPPVESGVALQPRRDAPRSRRGFDSRRQ